MPVSLEKTWNPISHHKINSEFPDEYQNIYFVQKLKDMWKYVMAGYLGGSVS